MEGFPNPVTCSGVCVVCGAWCMYGVCMVYVWCMVCGVWCVVRGAWCVVRGVWCMYGVCMVCGVWCVVCGVWYMLLYLIEMHGRLHSN